MLNIEEFIDSNELFDGHYKLIRPLNTEGGTADVWLAIDTNTIDNNVEIDDGDVGVTKDENSGMRVAIKIYRPKNALDIEGEQRFRDEFKIVYECRHANLLQPTSFSIYEGTPYLVLPYCKFGSSEQLIGKKLPIDTLWKFILDVSSGLNRLHTNEVQIVHQDIKPANVLIDNSNNFAITDFGISSKRGGTAIGYYDEENVGTMAYMAPERFVEGADPMAQSDIWAFGATLFEVITGKVPFGEQGGLDQSSKSSSIPTIPNIPADINRLIQACLSYEPGNRPSAAEIKDAALARQFPLKSRKWLYAVSSIALLVVLSVAGYFVKEKFDSDTININVEEVFSIARDRLDSDNPDSVKSGLRSMDSLCSLNYIPAIFEMAFTYGWFSDPISLKRKQMLGIEIYENGDEKYLPKLDKYNNETLALLQKIVDLNDSSYALKNAEAAYRLACYYVMPNKIYKSDNEKGKHYLYQALDWAKMTNDTSLCIKINKGLSSFEK